MKLLYYNSCQKNEEDLEYLDKGGGGNNAIETKGITPQNRTRAPTTAQRRYGQTWRRAESAAKCEGELSKGAWVIF